MPAAVCPTPGCVLPSGHVAEYALEHTPTLDPSSQSLAKLLNVRFDRLETLVAHGLAHLEKHMSTVAGIEQTAIADLTAAVDDLSANIGSLPQQLADAKAALAQAQAADVNDQAARDAALAQVATALDDATASAASIETQVGRIRSATPAPAPLPEGTVNAGEHDPGVEQQIVVPAGGDQPAQVAPITPPTDEPADSDPVVDENA